MSDSAFSQLHPAIQEQIYAMAWGELRPIQVQAINYLFNSDDHLVIAAQTASGKTEAAFLPILSQLLSAPHTGLGAVYVGPLKALINDQFSRLEQLCKKAEIAVHRWHGDVPLGQKRKLIEDPSGVLLITPESMESLLINKTNQLKSLFGQTKYVVIDELHSFIGNSRGNQLRSQWARLKNATGCVPRWIGLSATLGDLSQAGQWLCPDQSVRVIEDVNEERPIALSLQAYLRAAAETEEPNQEEVSPPATVTDQHLALDLFNQFKNEKALIFGNSKQKLEFYADQVRRLAQQKKHTNPFWVHHGSLARSERETVEAELQKARPTAVFCSSTLEMGIDVGELSLVGQLDAPLSVNSLVQRLGRSGRKEGQTAKLRLLLDETEVNPEQSLERRLYPRLIQAYAMIELALSKWCEPPRSDALDYSTLIQQLLSLIAQTGGISAQKLYQCLIEKGAFPCVKKADFRDLLHSLGESQLIEQMPQGDLILGITGEKLVRSFEFYATFESADEFLVLHQNRAIGSVVMQPSAGGDSYLILAGRRWKILHVDEEKKQLTVQPAAGGKLPVFEGNAWFDLAPEVVAKIRELLLDDQVPAYFNRTAKRLLFEARQLTRDYGLNTRSMITEGQRTYWFPWKGSQAQRTLMALCKYFGGLEVSEAAFCLIFEKTTPDQIGEALKSIAPNPPTAEEVAAKFPIKKQQKYDDFLPESLLNQQFAANFLDLEEASKVIQDLALDATP